MTTPTPESVKALADGLTRGEREVMSWLEPDVLYDYHRVNGNIRVSFFRQGLVSSTHAAGFIYMSLTPLGEAVAAHLGASHA